MGLGHTFGKTSKQYGGSKNVWHEVKATYPVGGKITLGESASAGDIIPAGSMAIYNMVAKTVEIVLPTDTAKLTNVNGLLVNDIVVDDAALGTYGAVTATIAYAGEIYIDRVVDSSYASLVDAATIKANLPQIVMIKEN